MTYSRSRSPMTAARTVRLTTGVNRAPMVTMMIAVPLPNSDRIRIDVMMIGRASSTSMRRMMISSVRPRQKPAMRPMMPPHSSARMVASGAMMSTVRAPAMVRANTSRPRSSVPNQCAGLGDFSDAKASWANGSWVMTVEKSAMKTQKSTMTRPIMNVGLRRRALIK